MNSGDEFPPPPSDFETTRSAVSPAAFGLRSMDKCAERHKWQRSAPCAREKPRGGMEIGLANLCNRKKIAKKPHAGRGLETIWEMSDETSEPFQERLPMKSSVFQKMASVMGLTAWCARLNLKRMAGVLLCMSFMSGKRPLISPIE